MKDEFEIIKSWCLFIAQYLIEKSPNALMIDLINNIKCLNNSKKSLKQLKNIRKDFIEWARGLSEDDIKELNNLLSKNSYENLDDARYKSYSEVNHILKRGRIKNEDEFRFLVARVDEIYANENKKAELESINKLLTNYEK